MCGLGLVASSVFVSQDRNAADDLFYVNAFRGTDSSGFAGIIHKDKKKTAHIRKTTDHPVDFIADKQYANLLSNKDLCAAIIHTRAATLGKIDAKNAHPFAFKNVVGVHNGTITGTFKGDDQYATDSEAIFALMNEASCDEKGWTSVLNEIQTYDTAYVLIWFDYRDELIHVVKNKERSFWLSYYSNGQSLMGASEEWMLQAVGKHNSCAFTNGGVLKDNSKSFTLSENVVFSFDPKKPMDRDFAELTVKPYVYSWSGGSTKKIKWRGAGWESFYDDDSYYSNYKTSQYPTVKPAETRSADNVLIPGFKGRMIKYSEFKAHLNNGCAWCSNPMDIMSPSDVNWIAEDDPVCPACMKRKEVADYVKSVA